MQVREAMSPTVLTVGPHHTLVEVCRQMAARKVGAAIVIDADSDGVGIITERDVLECVAAAQDPASERVSAHLSTNLVFAAPSWSLEQAAEAMMHGGFRHLVVLDGGEVAGIVSVRDIVRVWAKERSASDELVG